MNVNVFMPFDYVKYGGDKFAGEIGTKIGEIVRKIKTGGYVVDFGGHSYIIAEHNLSKHHIPSVNVITRRRYEDEDTE